MSLNESEPSEEESIKSLKIRDPNFSLKPKFRLKISTNYKKNLLVDTTKSAERLIYL